jgi:hypothetical protein
VEIFFFGKSVACRAFSGVNTCLAVLSMFTVADTSEFGNVDAGFAVLSVFAMADCSEFNLEALS